MHKNLPVLPLVHRLVLPPAPRQVELPPGPATQAAVHASTTSWELLVLRESGGVLAEIGIIADLIELERTPGAGAMAVIQARSRGMVTRMHKVGVVSLAEAVPLFPEPVNAHFYQEAMIRLRARLRAFGATRTDVPHEALAALDAIEDPAALADLGASLISSDPAFQQEVIECLEIPRRLDLVLGWLERAL